MTDYLRGWPASLAKAVVRVKEKGPSCRISIKDGNLLRAARLAYSAHRDGKTHWHLTERGRAAYEEVKR